MISLPDHIPDLRRLNGFRAVIIVILIVIVIRLWFLQLVKGPELAEMSQTQSVKTIRRVAPRGTIMDTKGRIIATNRLKFVVSMSPDDVKKHPETLARLAPLLHTTEEALHDKVIPPRLILPDKKVIVRGKPFDPVSLDRDVNIETLSQIEEQRLDMPGLIVTRDPVRYYKDSTACAHILGFTGLISYDQLSSPRFSEYNGGDFVGKDGLEAYYETELKGQDGGENVTVDARGRMLRKLGEEPPKPGHTLHLSVDLDLQHLAYDLLKEQYDGKNKLHPGQHTGAVVALNPNNGEVLAMVSMPSYDVNNYAANYTATTNNKTRPFFNRATSAAQPCGSPFKLITAAAGLETGNAGQWTTYYCPGYKRLGRRSIFRCDEVHGNTAFEKAIGASCNVYFYNVGENVGPQTLADWAGVFGLGKKTGIDLMADNAGSVSSLERRRKRAKKRSDAVWYPGQTLNMSIGQGELRVTPLQLADYTSALANGGTIWRPHLVHSIEDPADTSAQRIRNIEPEARGKLGLKPENQRLIVSGMQRAMQRGGTAYACAIPGLDIAGKTGTAEITGTKMRNSMFVCFAPVDHPQIAIAVMVEGGGFGSETAAPIARRLLAQYFHKKVDPLPQYFGAKD